MRDADQWGKPPNYLLIAVVVLVGCLAFLVAREAGWTEQSSASQGLSAGHALPTTSANPCFDYAMEKMLAEGLAHTGAKTPTIAQADRTYFSHAVSTAAAACAKEVKH
jgi:hypothetical protein